MKDDNLNQEIQKKIYVVLGMPRSGTSAVARGLNALGIDLGDQLIPGKTNWNLKGFFEDKDIVREINERILHITCDKWESIKILDYSQFNHPRIQAIRNKAVKLVKERFGSKSHWGYKDPRTARLIPFWQSIFSELDLQDHYVIALRNPLASAHSFKKLTKIDLEKALLLWLSHLIPAIDETDKKQRIVVSYDLLLQNPHLQLDRIKKYFNLNFCRASDLENYANEFLDKNLKHYEFSEQEFQSHNATSIIPVGLKVYDLLFKLAKDEISFQDEQFVQSWQVIKSEFNKIYPIYCYIDDLLKRNKEYERKFRKINKSLLWKMTYPLRLIDDKFREIRKKYR